MGQAREKSITPEDASFTRDLSLVEGWADLSASDEELDRLGQTLARNPFAFHRFFLEINAFGETLPPLLREAPAWQEMPSNHLALLVCGGEAVRRGIRTCTSLTLPSRTHALGIFLLILHHRAIAMHLDPLPWVEQVVLLWALGPRAIREIARRCEQHVGVNYGLAAYLSNKPESEDELSGLLKELQWLSIPYLQPTARRVIQDRRDEPHTLIPELGSAIAHQLDARSLLADPLTGLLRALNGRLDIFPRAVADQLTKDLRPVHQRKIDLTFQDTTQILTASQLNIRDEHLARPTHTIFPENDLEPALPLDALPDNARLSALDALVQNEELSAQERHLARVAVETSRLCASHVKYRIGHAATLREQSQRELAAQYRKDPDTIARYRKQFLSALKQRLDSK